jgi:uncharacterized phage protein (TIGR02220 family)
MAGDWIKVEAVTPDKPEVDEMAEILGVSSAEVLGRLVRVWIWADQQSIDGNAVRVTSVTLSKRSGMDNFAEAMRKVGWLGGTDMALTFPNFDRHNGETAKKRALTAKRVKRFRNESNVTSALPEKRREEGNSMGVCSSGNTNPENPTPSQETPARARPRRFSPDAYAILEFLNQRTGKNFRLVDVNLRLVDARLSSGVTPDVVRAVIVRKWREWKDRPDMHRYLRPETLFGATKFEQYVGEVPSETVVAEGGANGAH